MGFTLLTNQVILLVAASIFGIFLLTAVWIGGRIYEYGYRSGYFAGNQKRYPPADPLRVKPDKNRADYEKERARVSEAYNNL